MPAADLSRLRLQISQLILIIAQPLDFRRRLHDLYHLYGDHSYRAGQAVLPQVLLPSYRVPPLVTRQLEMELGKACREHPRDALPLLDTLWNDSYLEPRLLAASLLGALPVDQLGEEVVKKLRAWGRSEENLRLFSALVENGTVRLRREAPQLLIRLVEEWLSSPSAAEQALGLRALLPLVNDPEYPNLPVVFRLLGPPLQSAPAALHAELQDVLQALIRRTPVETAYFLRQALSLAKNQNTARLVRRCLPALPPGQQAGLRSALQARSLQDRQDDR